MENEGHDQEKLEMIWTVAATAAILADYTSPVRMADDVLAAFKERFGGKDGSS